MRPTIARLLFLIWLCTTSAVAFAGQQFVVSESSAGIVVYNIWSGSNGISIVKGGPFVPNPVPRDTFNNPEVSPDFIASDPSGAYAYALYGTTTAPLILWSFKLINGVPHQINSVDGFLGSCCEGQPFVRQMVVTAHYVWILTPQIYGSYGWISIFSTTNGVLKFVANYELGGLNNGVNPGVVDPLELKVDPNEHFAYVSYASSTNYHQYGPCTSAECVAVYDLDNKAAPILITTIPAGVGFGYSASVN